jgi:hypothetical protein
MLLDRRTLVRATAQVDGKLLLVRMMTMRVLPLIIVALLLFLAVSTFLIYGGQAAVHPTASVPTGRPPGSGEQNDPLPARDFGPDLQALSKRVDELVTRIDRLEQISKRTVAPMPTETNSTAESVRLAREDVFRAIAEERELRELPSKIQLLQSAVIACAGSSNYPDGLEIGQSLAILVEAQKKFGDIRRNTLPADPSVAPSDAQRAQYAQEVTALREWRRVELARIAGADAAQKLIAALGTTQPLPTTLP